jgi:hypothetical protein
MTLQSGRARLSKKNYISWKFNKQCIGIQTEIITEIKAITNELGAFIRAQAATDRTKEDLQHRQRLVQRSGFRILHKHRQIA